MIKQTFEGQQIIYRNAGPWTLHVHSFLHFLHNTGFTCVPKPIGIHEDGQEMVSFVRGTTYDYPLCGDAASLELLVSSAKLLRSYHDASCHFLPKNTAQSHEWMFPVRHPQEVMCHNDFAPYNICFDGKRAVGIIDFDTVHPGPCNWDIAYALYCFALFKHPGNNDGYFNLATQIARARLFCDEYGLGSKDRVGLVDVIIERLTLLLDFLLQSAEAGEKKYVLCVQDNHHVKYAEDIRYIQDNKQVIQEGLE